MKTLRGESSFARNPDEQVSDDDRSTLLSFLSRDALQNDKIITSILKVLFQYLGIGTRLALCSVIWMEAREFVILVPDPIIFEPVENKSRAERGSLCETRISRKTVSGTGAFGVAFAFRCSCQWWLLYVFIVMARHEALSSPRCPSRSASGKPCNCRFYKTHARPPFTGLFVSPRNKDDMGVPTDQLSHNHFHSTHGHCNNHIVTSCVFVLLAPIFITRRRRRVRCWTLVEDLFSEWEERKKSRAGGGAACESRKPCVSLECM